jgi:hypothetical protein
MPRFHFDVRESQHLIPDKEGSDCPGLNAAEREAVETAAEIGRDLLPDGKARAVSIDVRNEQGQRVLTVTVSLQIDRVEPSPAPPKAN